MLAYVESTEDERKAESTCWESSHAIKDFIIIRNSCRLTIGIIKVEQAIKSLSSWKRRLNGEVLNSPSIHISTCA